MPMTRLTAFFLSALLLVACGHRSEPAGAMTPAVSEAAGLPATGNHEPRPAALPFRLDVTMSGDVRRALDASGARLAVQADYTGKARRGEGLVTLGAETRDISARDQSITLAGRFDAGQVAREVSGDPKVKVSAAVNAEGGPVVYCTEFEEALPIAVETGGYIHCELISE
jgi:hypothetical protein